MRSAIQNFHAVLLIARNVLYNARFNTNSDQLNLLSNMFQQRILTLFLLTCVVTLLGCPPKPEVEQPQQDTPNSTAADGGSPQAAAPPQEEKPAEDPEAVKSLTDLGVTLKEDADGHVIAADCKPAGITDDQAMLLKGLPNLTSLSLENGQITNDGLKVLECVAVVQAQSA